MPKVRLCFGALFILIGGVDFLGVVANLTGLQTKMSIKAGLEVPTLVVAATVMIMGVILVWRPKRWGRLFFSIVAFDLAFTYGWIALINSIGRNG